MTILVARFTFVSNNTPDMGAEKEGAVRLSSFQHALLVFSGLMLLVFCAFYERENGDMNSVLFGTVLYLPYAFLLAGYNALVLMIVRQMGGFLNMFKVLVPIIPLALWGLLVKGAITIRFWELGIPELAWIIGTLGLLNTTLLIATNPKT